MKNGQIVESGTHDELVQSKGLYYELVNAQVFADVDEAGKRASFRIRILRSGYEERKERTPSNGPERKPASKETKIDAIERVVHARRNCRWVEIEEW